MRRVEEKRRGWVVLSLGLLWVLLILVFNSADVEETGEMGSPRTDQKIYQRSDLLPHDSLPTDYQTTIRLLVGVMITSGTTLEERNEIRATTMNLECSCEVDIVFFVGKDGNFSLEMQQYGDIVQMSFAENVNDGKTFEWFKYALEKSKETEYDAIFKMDTDTIVRWCPLSSLVKENLGSPFYLGRRNTFDICGGFLHCPPKNCIRFTRACWVYMSGGFYGVSVDVLEKIFKSNYTYRHSTGIEDLTFGKWIWKAAEDTKIVSVENGKLWCHSAFKSHWSSNMSIEEKWVECIK